MHELVSKIAVWRILLEDFDIAQIGCYLAHVVMISRMSEISGHEL